MHQRYVITITPLWKPLPDPLVDNPARRAIFELGDCRLTIDTPDGSPGEGFSIDRREMPERLTITEGTIIPTGGPGLLQSGSYNRLTLEAGCVTLHSDTLAALPCYYTIAGGALRIANSLRLLGRSAGAAADELGIAETFLLAHCVTHDRTILDGVRRVAGGVAYRFPLPAIGLPNAVRLATTWTTTIDDAPGVMVDRICDLWEGATARHFDSIDAPIGVMLSGGLDSRMVAGGLASRGRRIVALTHGDPQADEVRLAREVAAVAGARHVINGLDDAFTFERLALERTNQTTEGLDNPIWDASARLLAAEGVAHFTTGAGFDVLLGGERMDDPRRRFLSNLRLALLGPSRVGPATAPQLQTIANAISGQAGKRARNYAVLLAEPYRTMVREHLPAVREAISVRIAAIAASAPVTAAQVMERFAFEHGLEQLSRLQERQLLTYGTVLLPTYDRDLLAYLTNLSPGAKSDHYLYYRVLRRLYSTLARIRVTNLGVHVNQSQARIELARAWRTMRAQRLSSWVNFDHWMRGGDRLARYEALFLEQASFFDPDAIRAYFGEVRAGRRSLYDGNETLGFLNLAWLLDPSRAYPISPVNL